MKKYLGKIFLVIAIIIVIIVGYSILREYFRDHVRDMYIDRLYHGDYEAGTKFSFGFYSENQTGKIRKTGPSINGTLRFRAYDEFVIPSKPRIGGRVYVYSKITKKLIDEYSFSVDMESIDKGDNFKDRDIIEEDIEIKLKAIPDLATDLTIFYSFIIPLADSGLAVGSYDKINYAIIE